ANLEQRNLSSLKEAEFSRLRAVFQEELQRHGIKVSPNSAGVKIILTITGHLTGYIGVAQIRRADGTITEMESLGQPADSWPGNPQAAITLHKEFLFAQDRPIVDVTFWVDRKRAFALGLQEVYSYEWKEEHWVMNGPVRLPTRAALNRELRGFYYPGVDASGAYLPGEICGNPALEGKGWHCESFLEPMPVRSVPPNSITGKKSPAWFSATRFEEAGQTRVILTGRDGLARLYEDGPDPIATYSEWGSEITSIQSRCGNGWQILVTGKSDWSAADTVQAIELQDRVAQTVSQGLEIGGPVIALHNPSSRNSADTVDAPDAVAIVHDLQTGRYEAYRLTLTCGN
ncbi:MAG: hypothetical protein ACRD36_05965, partial [Candidatus Acidiferrum sp.]